MYKHDAFYLTPAFAVIHYYNNLMQANFCTVLSLENRFVYNFVVITIPQTTKTLINYTSTI